MTGENWPEWKDRSAKEILVDWFGSGPITEYKKPKSKPKKRVRK